MTWGNEERAFIAPTRLASACEFEVGVTWAPRVEAAGSWNDRVRAVLEACRGASSALEQWFYVPTRPVRKLKPVPNDICVVPVCADNGKVFPDTYGLHLTTARHAGHSLEVFMSPVNIGHASLELTSGVLAPREVFALFVLIIAAMSPDDGSVSTYSMWEALNRPRPAPGILYTCPTWDRWRAVTRRSAGHRCARRWGDRDRDGRGGLA